MNPASPRHRPATVSYVVGLLLAAFMLVCSLAVTEIPIPGTSWPWMTIIGGLLLLSLAAVCLRWRPHAMPTQAWIGFGAFVALIGWAGLRALTSDHVMGDGTGTGFVTIPPEWIFPPLVQALGMCVTAFVAVALIPVRDLFEVMWWLSAAGAVLTPVAWLIDDATWRVANPFGGAAVLHISLLLGASIALAAARARIRTRISILVALIDLVCLVFGYTRGGLVCLGLFGAMLSYSVISRRIRQRNLPVSIIALALVMVAVFALGVWNVLAARGSDFTSDGRIETWILAFKVWGSDASNMIIGTGYGAMWPWHAVERGDFPQSAFLGLLDLAYGPSLGHAHNLYVNILAELGIVGALLFAVVIAVAIWSAVKATNRMHQTLAMGLVATFVGFAFDTFLIKNFPIALTWWGVFFAVHILVRSPESTPGATSQPKKFLKFLTRTFCTLAGRHLAEDTQQRLGT